MNPWLLIIRKSLHLQLPYLALLQHAINTQWHISSPHISAVIELKREQKKSISFLSPYSASFTTN